MEWNIIVGTFLATIGTHLFLHEVVLAVRGFINMFTPSAQTIANAQNQVNQLVSVAQQIATTTAQLNTQVTALAPVQSVKVATIVSNFNTTASGIVSSLQSLVVSLNSTASTQQQIYNQQNSLQQSIGNINTTAQSLYTTISTDSGLTSLLATMTNIPGLTNSLLSNWNASNGLVSTASAIVGTQITLNGGDLITIISSGFFFNETQFDKYFKIIAANNNPQTQSALLIRWLGLLLFVSGIFLINNWITLNGFTLPGLGGEG